MSAKKKAKPIPQDVRDAAALFGGMGGKAVAKKLGKKGMSDLGKKGAAARWPEEGKE